MLRCVVWETDGFKIVVGSDGWECMSQMMCDRSNSSFMRSNWFNWQGWKGVEMSWGETYWTECVGKGRVHGFNEAHWNAWCKSGEDHDGTMTGWNGDSWRVKTNILEETQKWNDCLFVPRSQRLIEGFIPTTSNDCVYSLEPILPALQHLVMWTVSNTSRHQVISFLIINHILFVVCVHLPLFHQIPAVPASRLISKLSIYPSLPSSLAKTSDSVVEEVLPLEIIRLNDVL